MNFNSPSIERKMTDLVEAGERYMNEQQAIEDQWGSDRETWPTGQRERWDRLATAIKRNVTEVEDLNRYIERVEAALANPKNREPGFSVPEALRDGGNPTRRSDPWRPGSGDDLRTLDTPTGLKQRAQDAVEYAQGLPVHARELLADLVDREGHLSSTSALVVAATDDNYVRAFGKAMADPVSGHLTWTGPERESFARVQALRATMSLGGSASYLAPFQLDPTVVLTNVGSNNPLRQVARRVVTTQDTWNGVSSDGVTAEWLPENQGAADGSAAFERITAQTFKLATVALASYELLEDTNIAEQLPRLVNDAFMNTEATAFISGNGSTAPLGLRTYVAATTASQVSPTTAGAFGIDDVYKLDEALWPRARAGRPVWLMHRKTQNLVRRFAEGVAGSSYWTDLGGDVPPRLLGAECYEASALDSAVTTGSVIALLGDAQQFIIADRIGLTMSFNPFNTDTSTGRPTFTGQWLAHRRVGTTLASDIAWVGLVL